MSDHLMAFLVDDWENVTKNNQLVPLPASKPVNTILADYVAFQKTQLPEGGPEVDVLEEIIAGLKEYFEKCLGRILLYRYAFRFVARVLSTDNHYFRFERLQYQELLTLWSASSGDLAGKNACDVYGAEHLCRLLGQFTQ
jgi:mortality factor 4-like protein 1